MTRVSPSPDAAIELEDALATGASLYDLDELMGETDCPEGCVVEPDGRCPHGYESAAITAGMI